MVQQQNYQKYLKCLKNRGKGKMLNITIICAILFIVAAIIEFIIFRNTYKALNSTYNTLETVIKIFQKQYEMNIETHKRLNKLETSKKE